MTVVNLFTQPSFENGWTTGLGVGNAALTVVTATNPAVPGRSGTKVLRATLTTTGTLLNIWTSAATLQPDVKPGKLYRFAAYSRAQTAASQAQLYAEYRDAGGVMIAGSQVAGVAVQHLSSQRWVRAELTMPAAPANAVKLFMYFRAPGAGVTAGQWLDFDAVIVHEIAAAGDPTVDYFDGNTPADATFYYQWDGPREASTSRKVGRAPLPTNRSNTTPAETTHAADHNALDLAVNDTVARIQKMETDIMGINGVATYNANGLYYWDWSSWGMTWDYTPVTVLLNSQTGLWGDAGINVQLYAPHNNALQLVLQANYVLDGRVYTGDLSYHMLVYGKRRN